MPNRLAAESSPYLLQHAGNPVEWHPWDEEAFSRAREEDKPIFLSIGYSTCHWCHVMEHESFENEAIARVLNEHFVSIKVDREERPDVDRVYMLFVQATTGAGGWPMSVWLTPDLKPFYGGTYFPPESRWGRAGFPEVLREIARLWREDRARLLASADALMTKLRDASAGELETADERIADLDALETGVRLYRRAFDARHGGFGSGPKFPRPSELLFLLRAWYVNGDDTARTMVLDTLRAMVTGGMYDHVGGGFHRYAVDGEWRVPHFEKMLYDQAQLVIALLEAAQASGEPFWTWIAAETLEYVERDLSHPDGGFYSAEDADSLPPESDTPPDARKMEGAFYLWSTDEIDDLLGADAEVVKTWFGMLPGGNAPHDPQGEFGTKNILYRSRSLEDVAAHVGRPPEDVTATILRARRRLREVRALRPRPHLDDKVLTAWNGLMIAAFARAARVMDGDLTPAGDDARTHYLARAERAAQFLRRHLWDDTRGVLLRRERAGASAIDGFAEDYAYLTWGLIELFQATGNPEWLRWTVRLQERQDTLFWDEAQGGWFSTTGEDPSILLRLKEDYDGAEPAAASVSVLNLLALTHLVDREEWRVRAARALARMGQRAGELARQVPLMLCGLAAWHQAPEHVVIVGEPDAEDTGMMRRALATHYEPFALLVPISPITHDEVATFMPWTRAMDARGGRATAYVCRDFACEAPAGSANALDELLAAPRAREAEGS